VSTTLAQIEQDTARRLGPYSSAFTDRQIPNTAQFTFASFPQLQSQIDLDSVTNLWLLRRGVTWDGTPITLDVVDRQRLVASYDPEMGCVYPDHPWGTIPSPGEVCEFHHLNPEQELRVAVLAGLRRCFLPDLIQVQPTAQYGGIDVTAQLPWLTDPWQIDRVQYGWLQPWTDAPFEAVSQGGHIILMGSAYWAAPVSMWLSVWRPAWSRVNGLDSSGPTLDSDVLDVDLDYAAAAGHIEAWHRFPARLMTAAAGGTQATQVMAAAEFSYQARMFGPSRPTTIGFRSSIGLRPNTLRWSGSRTWVNR
jgi:hypothetical protein